MKETNLKKLCTVQFQLYNILEKAKPWKQSKDQCLPSWGREMIGKVQRLFKAVKIFCMAPDGSDGKELTCNARAAGEAGSIPGSGRSPGEGNGNPLQCSCLGNSMDGAAWQATVHGGHKESDTIEGLHFHFICTYHFTFSYIKLLYIL